MTALVRNLTYENTNGDNPTAGARSVTIDITDGDGGATPTENLTINVGAVNDAPVADLNGADGGGIDYSTTFDEGDSPVSIVDSDATITDPDHSTFEGLGINLGGFVDGASEVIAINGEQFVYAVSRVVSTTVGATTFDLDFDGSGFTITELGGGSSPEADLQTLLRTITYNNTSQNPTAGNRTFNIIPQDASSLNATPAAVSTVSVSAVNDAPVITSNGGGPAAAINVAENTTAVTTVTSTDVDGGAASYSITGGADAAKFAINSSTGVLTFMSAPDFESPTDGGTDNVYDVTVQVSDGTLTDTQAMSVTVTDVTSTLSVTTTSDQADGDTSSVEALNADMGDDGVISLREAILAANNTAGANTITFNIALSDAGHFYYQDNAAAGFGAPVQTSLAAGSITDFDTDYPTGHARSWWRIAPTTPLPGVSDILIIDATTQSGYASRPIIEIDGSDAPFTDGLYFGLSTAGSEVHGLVINNFGDDGIEAIATGYTFTGNYIGTDVSGTIDAGNGDVGLQVSGTSQIGGTAAGEGNVIAGNDGTGLKLGGDGHVVEGNLIGVGVDGSTPLGNLGNGIRITLGDNITIGGTAAGAGNTIAGNSLDGIVVENANSDGIAILGNAIYSNGGEGIDLGNDGVTTNDPGDADPGANTLQNFPAITSAETDGSSTLTVAGTLNSAVSTSYRIEFFSRTVADPSAHGEAERYLGSLSVTTDGSGNASFNQALSASVADGEFITATATVDLGGGNFGDTSEFAQNIEAQQNTVAPVISSDGGGDNAALNVAENSTTVTTVTATDTDLPADTLTYSISGGADAAKFAINTSSGVLTFVSAPDYESPTDSGTNNVYNVIVQVSDGALTDTQAIAVTVTDVDEFDITAISDTDATLDNVDENATVGTTVGVTAFASDGDATTNGVTYSLDDDATGQFAINGSSELVTVAGAIDREAGSTRTITVRATSDDGSFSTKDFTIAINDLNDNAPVIDSGQSFSVSEFAANGDSVGAATATDADTVGEIQNWTIVSGNDDGVFDIDSTFGLIRVTDNALLNFETTATYLLGLRVEDGANVSSTQTVTVNVVDENDVPVLVVNAGVSVVEGSDVIISSTQLSVSDEDEFSAAIVYSIADSPTAGRIELVDDPGVSITEFTQADIDNNRVRFVHDGSEADDSFTFTISDGSRGTIGTTLFSIANLRVNDAPVNSSPTSQTTAEDTSVTFSSANGNSISVSDVDLNGGLIGIRLIATSGTVTLGSTTGLVFAVGNGSNDSDMVFAGQIADINNALEGLTFAPTADYNGPASIRVITRDMGNSGSGGEQIDDDTINISVTAVNDNPVAAVDEFSTSEDNTLSVTASAGLLANDSDIDGDSLSVTVVNGTANGILSLNPDGSFTYQPNANFNGEDSFTYRAVDGSLQSEIQTVTLTVTPVNDAPVSNDDQYTVDQLTVLKLDAANGVLVNDLDVEADALQAVLVSGPQNGRLVLNADGSLTYTPNAPFFGEDTFTYRSTDGTAAGTIATVRIVVRQTVTSGTNGGDGDAVVVEESDKTSTDVTNGVDDGTQVIGTSVSDGGGGTSTVVTPTLPSTNNQVEGSREDTDTTTVAGTTLTVGYIVWLLRSGSIVFGLVSSLPAWTMMDPLPVLQSGLEALGDGDNSDDDSLQGILQAHHDGLETPAESFES